MLYTQKRALLHKSQAKRRLLVALGLLVIGLFFPPLLLVAFGVFLLALKEYNAYKTWHNGFIGESSVIEELWVPDSVLLSDIHLPGKRGNIDHVLVSPWGIFVLETKNYSGEYWVQGDIWKTRGYRGRRKVKVEIRNPSVEVQRETKAISSFLKRKTGREYQVHPIIVLTGNAKVHGIRTSKIPILPLDGVLRHIEGVSVVLTPEDVSGISQALSEYAGHIKDMRENR